MLEGETVRLRLVREDDLPALQAFDEDISNRGDFYPVGVVPLPTLVARFGESGLWRPDEGLLVITDLLDREILGHIEFFATVSYLDELELSYILYSAERRGRGIVTEAVRLLTAYLFDRIAMRVAPGLNRNLRSVPRLHASGLGQAAGGQPARRRPRLPGLRSADGGPR